MSKSSVAEFIILMTLLVPSFIGTMWLDKEYNLPPSAIYFIAYATCRIIDIMLEGRL